MRALIGWLIALAGIALGVWLDIFVFLVGGIKEVIDGFSAHPHISGDIAWGLVKCIAFNGLGIVAAVLIVLFGIAVGKSS
jgi:hypothetical protein